MNYNCKEDLQELIIHDIMKFTQEAIDFAEKNQAKMTDLSKMAKAMDTTRC